MKNLILSLIFLCSFSVAQPLQQDITKVVEARGYGPTSELRLKKAKLNALGEVVGAFIIAELSYRSDRDKIFENIKEYYGGYIESYQITAETSEYTEIKAIVRVVKDNKVYIQGDNEIDIEDELNNYNSKREIIDYLDNPANAFHVKVNGINIEPQPHNIRFKINSNVMWQPKWISDLETFVTEFTNKGKTSQNINVRMVSQRGFQPGVGIVQSLFESKPKQSDEPMVCFAENSGNNVDQCRNLAGGFMNMPRYSEMPIYVNGYSKDDELIFTRKVLVKSINLYESVYRNQTKKYFLMKRTFDQPAYIVYKKGNTEFNITIDVNNNIAEQIKTFKLEASL